MTFAVLSNLCFGQTIPNKIILKINYRYVDVSMVDDTTVFSSELSHFLTEEGNELLLKLSGQYPNIGKLKATKLFPFMLPKDTVSIGRAGNKISIPPFWSIFRLSIPEAIQFEKLAIDLHQQTELVDYAHFDFYVDLESIQNDTLYPSQYSLNDSIPGAGINVEEAWDIETGEPFIKVAVHDNGIDSLHPDLKVVFGAGYNDSDYPENSWGLPGGHGTPVAGIIGATRNDSTGIAGIAGGNGTDTSGCSLIDLRYTFGTGIAASYFMASVVDAARKVYSYWDYPDVNNNSLSGYFNNAPGFGVHVGNHSYVIKTIPPLVAGGEGKILDDDNIIEVLNCQMCTEAFLFSLQNGVINVVARGNSGSITPDTDPTIVEDLFPQNLADNWIISVGASGYDGNTVQSGLNQSPQEAFNGFYSLYSGNMDIIAPGSDSIVYSTYPNYEDTVSNPYGKFNGTSAAAPHVSGVTALLLSHYNKGCYNRRNLSIEDVEYILEKSADNPYSGLYNDTIGWGKLNAGKALKMIENPTKQIVHPDSLLSSVIVERDTIALYYHQRLFAADWGPISHPWPLERERHYQVERIKVENVYSFDSYIQPTTTILDYWARPSISNATEFHVDTFSMFGTLPGGLTGQTYFVFDTLNLNPFVSITDFDQVNNTCTTEGYYYHFISKYLNNLDDINPDTLVIVSNENYWYPVNLDSTEAYLPFSIYIQDDSLSEIYDFPCDSLNYLYDDSLQYLGVGANFQGDDISVFPNPFKDEIRIDFNDLEGHKRIDLLDIKGSIIKGTTSINNSITIDTNDLSSGLYLLNCIVGDKRYFKKIIKP